MKRRATPSEHKALVALGWHRVSNAVYDDWPKGLRRQLSGWVAVHLGWKSPPFPTYQAAVVYAAVENWGQ